MNSIPGTSAVGQKSGGLLLTIPGAGGRSQTINLMDTSGNGSAAAQYAAVAANAKPVANDDNGATTENAAVTVDVLANDTDDAAGLTLVSASGPDGVGFVWTSGGSITFDPRGDFDDLPAGATRDVVITYIVRDEGGKTDTATLTVTVTGTNDGAVVTGTATGVVTEDGADNVESGQLSVTDVDSGEASFRPVTNASGEFGSLTLTANGQWTYTLDNSRAATQGLAAGQIAFDSFTVQTVDDTQQLIDITVTGVNDAAVIGGTTARTVTEDADNNLRTGQLTISDADTGQASFVAQSNTNGTYGRFSVTGDGAWTYTLT